MTKNKSTLRISFLIEEISIYHEEPIARFSHLESCLPENAKSKVSEVMEMLDKKLDEIMELIR